MSLREPLNNDRAVRVERTGWRDQQLSARHREWGYNLPMADMDWPVVEYDRARVAALVEYKHDDAQTITMAHPSNVALGDLGNRANLPYMVVRYARDFDWWLVHPGNPFAERLIGSTAPVTFTEAGYVEMMYRVRGYAPPADLARRLAELV